MERADRETRNEAMRKYYGVKASTRIACLACLYVQAIEGHGWTRRGVRGWRFYEEVTALTGARIPEYLPNLALGGLLDRIDVRMEGAQRPLWIYRISATGVRVLGETWEATPRPVPEPLDHDPEEGSLYIPANCWRVLEVLRVRGSGKGPLRFGTWGWMSAREIRAARGVTVSEDLPWLLYHGFMERRDAPIPERIQHPSHLYRITKLGFRTELVYAAPVGQESPMRVQARLREPDA